MDYTTPESTSNGRRTAVLAAVVGVLVLVIGIVVFVLLRRDGGSGGPGPQTIEDVPQVTVERTGSGDGVPAETGEEGVVAAPVDLSTNRLLTDEEKVALGYPRDAVVRLRAVRDQDGNPFLQYEVEQSPADADDDGISDAEESRIGTDPSKADTDGDRLTDYEETVLYGTDPLKPDTDGDGVSDGEEVLTAGTDPSS